MSTAVRAAVAAPSTVDVECPQCGEDVSTSLSADRDTITMLACPKCNARFEVTERDKVRGSTKWRYKGAATHNTPTAFRNRMRKYARREQGR